MLPSVEDGTGTLALMYRPPAKRPIDHDPDAPRPEDIEDFGDATRDCPKCGATLYDDVSVCYKCGHMLDGSDEEKSGPPPWVIYAVIALLIAILLPFVLRVI